MADALLDPLFGDPAVDTLFDERAHVQGMLDFEAALARVEARLGLVPEAAALAIAACCHAGRFDLAVLGAGAPAAGNTAIPMVGALRRRVAETDPAAAEYVHFGATSQDAMDTGLVLQLRAALAHVQGEVAALAADAAAQAQRHRDTPLPGRTWLQHALPVTLGLKAAGWVDALRRHEQRMRELRRRVLVLQFGGAAGTLASLHPHGPAVAEALAAELGLGLPALPWHTHRDRVAETGTVLALLVGTLGKIARDISLLMQTDVGEAAEPAAAERGGSSSMPHKRNPVACAAVLAAALRAPGLAATLLSAMVQEHERGLGGWHAEWTALPELVRLAGGALTHTRQTVAGLEARPARMRANLDTTGGQIMAEAVKMALAPHLGAQEAHALVKTACRSAAEQGRHLREVLRADARVTAVLDAGALERVLDPAGYLGASAVLVDGVLAEHRGRR